jgi:hypothetical protein
MTQPDTGGIIMTQAACRPALRELPRRIDAFAERSGIATGTNSAEPEGAVRAHGDGDIRHLNGITASPGLHVAGMRWQTRRSSTFLDGTRHDAAIVVAQVIGDLHGRRTRVGSAA